MTAWTHRQGGHTALVTFTQRHELGDDLAELMRSMSIAASQAFRLSPAAKDLHGLCGYQHVSEMVHTSKRGWNVHRHGILFLDHQLDEYELLRLRDRLAAGFIRSIRRGGGNASQLGQDITAIAPGDEGQMASYCFKGTKRWSQDATRTPLAIAYDYTATGSSQDGALLRELAEAVDATRIRKRRGPGAEQDRTRRHGLRHFTPSPGLDALCGCDQPHPTAA